MSSGRIRAVNGSKWRRECDDCYLGWPEKRAVWSGRIQLHVAAERSLRGHSYPQDGGRPMPSSTGPGNGATIAGISDVREHESQPAN